MVFGGCSIPSTGGFGCSASVRSQMVSIPPSLLSIKAKNGKVLGVKGLMTEN